MKALDKYIQEGIKLSSKSKVNTYNYHPKTHDELKELVNKLIKERGNEADLNDIDTSEITDMEKLFYKSEFNGDISKWDVSNVKDMDNMFAYSEFNGDISKWDVSNVKSMMQMFYKSKFTGKNGNIDNWDVNKLEYNAWIFIQTPLEKNPPKWYK